MDWSLMDQRQPSFDFHVANPNSTNSANLNPTSPANSAEICGSREVQACRRGGAMPHDACPFDMSGLGILMILRLKHQRQQKIKNNYQTTGKKRDPLSFMNVEFVRLESPISEFIDLNPV